MKKLLFLLLVGSLLTIDLNAQVRTPAPSPFQKIEQSVGLSKITIEYSRPGIKGRQVFGDLVPYDQVWRTGANAATKITFDDKAKVGGEEVAKGSYAVLTKPGMSSWDVMFFKFEGAGVGGYMDKDPDVTVTVNSEKMDHTLETFTINVHHLRNESAHITMAWENTLVQLPVELETDAQVMASIEKTMGGPSANDYSSAASYYLASGKDMDKALKWINKSLDMNPDRFWIVRTKSLIQAKMGDYKGAVASAEKSLELATKAENKDYIKMNKESIAKWSKMKM